jgi:hypothetical protein
MGLLAKLEKQRNSSGGFLNKAIRFQKYSQAVKKKLPNQPL